MTTKEWDFIIIGAGPSGLTFASLCALNKIKVLLIEKEKTIGGCHRVNRILDKTSGEYLFSEHGPRIYSSSFLNLKKLLKLIEINFYDYFTPYNFNSLEFAKKSILEIFTLRETLILFSNILFNVQKEKITMKEFMEYYNFSEKAKIYIDGLCRVSDGSGYDRYRLEQFTALINQQSLYGMYQPKKPLDIGLFKYWENYLLDTKYVDIKKSTLINKCVINQENKISQIIDMENNVYYGKNIILACPPNAIVNILRDLNIPDAFINFDRFSYFAKETAYLDYIPIIFHWDKKINLPKERDFPPTSEWGIIYAYLSDYLVFDEKVSKTVISASISKTNVKSSFLNKTADECDKDELIVETLRQLKLENPTVSLISPNVYKDKVTNRWKNVDTAFFNTAHIEDVYFKSDKYENLYTIGTHNKNSNYYFTSFESAVSNAIVAFNKLNDNTEIKLEIDKPIEILTLLKYFFIILICYILIIYLLPYKLEYIIEYFNKKNEK